MESIFDLVSDKFFNPLCGVNRRIYFGCISLLVSETRRSGATGANLYEKEIKDMLAVYLKRQGDDALKQEADNPVCDTAKKTPQEQANDVLAYFKSCGWVTTDIGRNGVNTISVSPYCIPLVDALNEMHDKAANHDRQELRTYLLSMLEILASTERRKSPYLMLLKPLLEEKKEFESRLVSLRENIRVIMQSLRGKESISELTMHMASGDFSTKFFPEFYRLQNGGKAPQYISEIARKMRAVKNNDRIYDSIIKECQDAEHLDSVQAEEKVDDMFEELSIFLSNGYEEETDFINQRIGRYWKVYSAYLQKSLEDGKDVSQVLGNLLAALKDLDQGSRDDVLEKIFDGSQNVMSIGYIGDKSFQKPKETKKAGKTLGITAKRMTKEEMHQAAEDFFEDDPYGAEKAAEFFNGILKDKDKMGLEECGLHGKGDVLMLMSLVANTCTNNYPFGIDIIPGIVETDEAYIRNLEIKRKGNEG